MSSEIFVGENFRHTETPLELVSETNSHIDYRAFQQPTAMSLVIPAYNEEKRIGKTLDALLPLLTTNDEVIVVFDGDDQTPEVVESYGDRVKLLTSPRRLGKGGAILKGFKVANNPVIGFIDADNSVLSSDVIRLASLISEESPCVIGSRWVKNSTVKKNEPFFNVFAGRIFHYLTFFLLGLRVKDTQCGAKFFSRSIIDAVLPKITITSRMIDVALLYHVKLLRKDISEVGITWEHKELTKLPIVNAIPFMFATLIGLRIGHSKRFKHRARSLAKFVETIEHH